MANMDESSGTKIPYLRVGTNYFKIIDHPLASKDTIKKIISWNGGIINEDHGADYKRKISKYDSFCNIPDNINYQRNIGNSYNLYEPIDHLRILGKFETIELFLKHIFSEQYILGLD